MSNELGTAGNVCLAYYDILYSSLITHYSSLRSAMLSRVADSLYWMSRYLERAEHTARLLDVQLNLMLEQSPDESGGRWLRLLRSLNVHTPIDGASLKSVPQMLTLDATNPASIVACVTAARDNARQVREQISSEMWEQLNELYLDVLRARTDDRWQAEPHQFF